ncbi:dehydrogenase/reductase SDR family member 13b.1 [Brachyhypopomus gauderio]|uniref:dehydrogenase/reductase SDR family member 13b.1 n=1 Tax=Brachyhypopomus gauderio TaxID=698409 RepID=UPI0040412CCF
MSAFILAVGVIIGVCVLIRTVVSGPRCTSKVKLKGKTVVITGSNTGIGRETAVDLARRGARVILACRSKVRAEAALAIVKRDSQSNNVAFMQLDLASQKSVRNFAETFLKSEKRLDILINNAGVYKQGTTEDGLGLMFGVNHLGHFLLTNLLLDRLKECGPSRIINVASMVHTYGNLDFSLLSAHKEFGTGDSFLDVLRIYNNSKLCNVLFTHELANRLRGTNVTCFSLHPGAVSTELSRSLRPVVKHLLKPVIALFFKDACAGAQTTLHCALEEGIEGLSGRYFSDCAVRKVQRKARDDAVAKKLWEVSERLCSLS